MSGRGMHLAATSMLVVAGVGALLAVGWPVGRMTAESFVAAAEATAPPLGGAIAISTALSLVVTVLATGLGFALALTARTLPRVPRRLLDAAIGGLVLVPPYTVAAALVAVGGRSGLFTAVLPDVYGLPGMAVAMTLAHLPIAYLMIRVAWRGVDPRLVETARVNGARAGDVIRLVLLPPLRGPLGVTAALTFVSTLSDPSIPAVLRGRVPILAHTAYIEVIAWGGEGTAALIAVLLTLPVLPMLLMLWRRPREALLETRWLGRGASPALVLPPSPPVQLCRVLSVLVLGVVLVLGLTSLAAMFRTQAQLVTPAMGTVISSTIQYALAALLLAAPLGVLTAWASARLGKTVARGVDLLQITLMLLPDTTLGIALFLAYGLATPTPWGELPALVGGASLGSGAVALVIAFAVQAVPLVHLAARAGQRRTPRTVQETARLLGASSRRRTVQFVLPHAGALVAAIAAAVTARNIVSVAPIVFVSTPEAPMVASFALDLLDRASFEQTCALTGIVATLVAGACALVVAASWAMAGRRGAS